MTLLFAILASALAASSVAAGLRARMWRHGRALTKEGAVLLAVFGAASTLVGGSKTNSPPLRAMSFLVTNAFAAIERLTGYAVSSASTNETHDLTMPEGAQIAEDIARRGAHQDGFWLADAFTNRLGDSSSAWVQTDGTVTLRSRAHCVPIGELALHPAFTNLTVFAPLQGSYGFLPGSRWPSYFPSRIWTSATDAGSRVVTWENALLNRDPSSPVSFQVEFSPDGNVVYRYSSFPTNPAASIGLFRNGHCQLSPFNFQPSTLQLSYIGDLGDGTGDFDSDGLTDWEEVMRYHTDPREADTDGDGFADGAEAQGVTDPLDPDSDGDGLPDGWTQAEVDAHRLLNAQPGDRAVAIRLAAPTPPGNHAVLRIGGLPVLLCETNAWTFSVPAGTVWNVELRTGGLPVVLALEAGAGVFVEDGDRVFASCATAEAQSGPPMRSAPPPSQPPGGSRGGRARIHAPCIFLEPVIQHVHGGGSATVTARCIPEAAPLAGRLDWSFDPPYLAHCVEVADDRLSATVSGLGAGWLGSVKLHADVGADPPAGLSTSAIVYFCDGREGTTNAVSFQSPHTNATVNPVFRTCQHPFGDDGDVPHVFLEAEVGRETTSGWQHLAWLDADPDTPGFQRRAGISRDNPPALRWNAKADAAQPLSDDADSHFYDANTTFARALPAVAAGQYAPPPFVTIVTRTFDDKGRLRKALTNDLAIPQYVQVTWDAAVLEEFRQPVVFNYPGVDELPPTNVTIFAGCTAAAAATAFSAIPAKVKDMFPADANIVVVGPDANVPQPHKTVVIQTGKYVNPTTGAYSEVLGLTPNEHCHERNDSPLGTTSVFNGTIREYILNSYLSYYIDGPINGKNNWGNVPLPLSGDSLTVIIAQVALHECCHTMGLVPSASAISGGHNDCLCGSHYMDDGASKDPPMRLDFDPWHIQRWMQNNVNYLEFVFPDTP